MSKEIFESAGVNTQDFWLVIWAGTKANTITVAPKSQCQYTVAKVDSVQALEKEGKWLVILVGDNFTLKYTSSNPDWGTVLPGQHVAYATVNGITKNIARRPHTVGQDVPLTNQVQESPVPKGPIILIDENNEIHGVNVRNL